MKSLGEAPAVELEVPLESDPVRGGLLRPVLVIVAAVGCLGLVYLSPLHDLLMPTGEDGLRATLAGFGPWAAGAFLLLCAAGVGLGAPRLAFSAAAGLAFGAVLGSVLAQAGTMLGCAIAFGWSRWLGGNPRRQRSGRLQRLIARVERHPVATNVVLRLFPLGNNLALNVLFGLSPIGWRDFLLGTLLGTLPATVIYAMFGSSAHSGSTGLLLTAGGLLLALTVVSTLLLRRSPTASVVQSPADAEH